MSDNWTDCNTLQELAAAQARGDEIEVRLNTGWELWTGTTWFRDSSYRYRPKKHTKTIVLREALFGYGNCHWTRWCTDDYTTEDDYFVRWLDTPAREVEVRE